MCPIHLPLAFLVFEGRQLHRRGLYLKAMSEKESLVTESYPHRQSVDTENEEDKYTDSYLYVLSRVFRKYGEWANNVGEISQDIPFNRFVLYTFFYLIFLAIIILKIFDTSLSYIPIAENERGHWKLMHLLLTTYLISFILSDLAYGMIYSRGLSVFKHFWRLTDLITHLLLAISIICNWVLYRMEIINNCSSTIDHQEGLPKNSSFISNDSNSKLVLCQKEDLLDQISVVTFAIGK